MIGYEPEYDKEEDVVKIYHYYRTPDGLVSIEPYSPFHLPPLPRDHPLYFGSYKEQSSLMQSIVTALLEHHDPETTEHILSQIITKEATLHE